MELDAKNRIHAIPAHAKTAGNVLVGIQTGEPPGQEILSIGVGANAAGWDESVKSKLT
jgi:hypothetical protein